MLSGAFLTATPNAIEPGQTTTINAIWTGGTGPYVVYLYNGNSPSCSSDLTLTNITSTNSNAVTFSSNPTSSQYYCTSVTDEAGIGETSNSVAVFVNVYPVMTIAAFPISQTLDAGQSSLVHSIVSGGAAPYVYQWLAASATSNTYSTSEANTLCSSSAKSSTCNFSTSGSEIKTANTVYVGHNMTLGPYTIQLQDLANVANGVNAPAAIAIYYSGVLTNLSTISAGATETFNTSGHLLFVQINSTFSGLYAYQKWANIYAYANLVPAGTYSLELNVVDSNGLGISGTTFPVNVIVNSPLLIGAISPSSVSIDQGQSITLGESWSGGTAPYNLTWFSGTSASCALDTTVVHSSSTSAVSGAIVPFPSASTYYCARVSDSATSPAASNSISALIVVNPALGVPTIAPQNSVIDVGGNVILTANTVGGTAPYVYQWYSGPSASCASDGAIANANSMTYLAVPSSNTFYCVRVTDSAFYPQANSISNTVGVTVNAQLSLGLPGIVPQNTVMDVGQSETLTANVFGGTMPYSYAWIINTNQIAPRTQSVIIHANSSDIGHNLLTLDLRDPQNGYASATGSASIFNDPTISMVASNSPADVGQAETFTIHEIGGAGPLTVGWNITLNNAPLAGSSNAIISPGGFDNISFSVPYPGSYRFEAFGIDDGTTSPYAFNSATGQFTASNALGFGTIAVTIPNSVLEIGQAETVTANVIGGTAPYSYTWYLNGVQLASSTQSTIIHGNASDLGSDNVSVKVTDSANTIATAHAGLTVNSALSLGSPSVKVPSGTIDVGQLEVVTANVIGGTLPYSYAWKLNGNAIGTNSNTVTINGNSSDIGTDNVMVTVTDAENSVAKGSGLVKVNPVLSLGTVQVTVPNSIIEVGQYENLVANAMGGTAPYSYTWNVLGSSRASGNTISFHGNSSDIGTDNIFVTVTDSANSFIIGVGTVTVVRGLSVSQPAPNGIALDQLQNVSLTAAASNGIPAYAYQWLATAANGVTYSTAAANSLCSSAQTATCSFFTTTNTAIGTYRFELSAIDSRGLYNVSAPTTVIVNPQLLDPILPTNPQIDSGQSINLTEVWSGGTAPYNMTWYTGNSATAALDTNIAAQFNGLLSSNSVSITVSPTSTEYYFASITDSANTPVTRNSPVDAVFVNSTLGVPTIFPHNPTVLSGNGITLTANFIGGTGPYTYQWYSGPSASCASDNAIVGANSLTYNIAVASTSYYCIGVTDNALFPATENSLTDLVMVNNSLTLGIPQITLSTGSLIVGQNETVTANIIGGLPPIGFTWFLNGNTLVQSTKAITFFANASDLGTDTISVNVIDSANVMESANAIVNVTAAPATTTTISNGGGGGGPPGGGPGGGSSVPLITQVGSCYLISNLAVPNTASVTLNGTRMGLTMNFIGPNNTGVTINSFSGTLLPNKIQEISNNGAFNYTVELTNISYIPIEHTVTLKICSSAVPSGSGSGGGSSTGGSTPGTNSTSTGGKGSGTGTGSANSGNAITTTIPVANSIVVSNTIGKVASPTPASASNYLLAGIILILLLLFLLLFLLWRRRKKKEDEEAAKK
jgi:hypothetical protein